MNLLDLFQCWNDVDPGTRQIESKGAMPALCCYDTYISLKMTLKCTRGSNIVLFIYSLGRILETAWALQNMASVKQTWPLTWGPSAIVKWEARASGHTWLLPTAACQGCISWRHTKGWAMGGHSLPCTEPCQRGSRWHRMIPPRVLTLGSSCAETWKGSSSPRLCQQCLSVLQATLQPWHSLAVELAAELPMNSQCGLTHVCACRAMASDGEDSGCQLKPWPGGKQRGPIGVLQDAVIFNGSFRPF